MQKNKVISKLGEYLPHLLFFLSAWFLLSIYYGDVMYIAQQNSFFSTKASLMDFVTSHRPYGYLWWLGRAFLQLFYYPILGGAVTSLMLALISGLIMYVFRIRQKFALLQFLPAFLWIGYLFFQGYELYYQAETGMILGIPLCVLIILILQSGFIRTFSKRRIYSTFAIVSTSQKQRFLDCLVILFVPLLLILGSEQLRPYVRPTAHMQRSMQAENWEEMKRTAKECKISARPIAAYYAIALMQTGEITQSLFDIEYNYMDLYLYDRNGGKDFGTAYYESDGNFYAGLINTAYRNALEQLTMDGPSALNLKRLAEASLLNGEHKLCEKYLKILESMPFESEFVERTKALNKNTELVAQNTRLNKILQLRPVEDSFETLYREPLFLGYNIALLQGRSIEALHASLAACLYSKLIPNFLIRTEPLVNSTLPQNVQDALIMESDKNPNISKIFQFDEFSLQKYEVFLNMSASYKGRREIGAKELKKQFLGFYPYYYYYGNIHSESQKTESTEKKSETRVN